MSMTPSDCEQALDSMKNLKDVKSTMKDPDQIGTINLVLNNLTQQMKAGGCSDIPVGSPKRRMK